MASVTDILEESAHERSSPATLTAFIDKWIYVFMAGLILAIVLAAFIPDSIGMLAAIKAGEAPPIPPILHVHAVLMGSWVLLLLTQATLIATGRKWPHMHLGLLGMVLAPAIVAAGLILVPTRHSQYYALIAAAPPAVAAQMRADVMPFATNVILGQLRMAVLFSVMVTAALYLRTRDSETHKRLLILATVSPLPAAYDRMWYLPTTVPGSPLAWEGYGLLVASPMIAWDFYRRRGLQKAYAVWLALLVPTGIAMNLLWNTSWWQETGPRLVGQG